MDSEQVIFAITSWVFLTTIVYTFTGWRRIYEGCFKSAYKNRSPGFPAQGG